MKSEGKCQQKKWNPRGTDKDKPAAKDTQKRGKAISHEEKGRKEGEQAIF